MRGSPTAASRLRALPVVAALLAAALVVTLPGALPARAADPRLERAQAKRAEAQQRLDAVVTRLGEVETEVAEVEARLAALSAEGESHQQQASAANAVLAGRIREAYTLGSTDPGIALLASESPEQALEQARLLGLLAMRSRAQVEGATAARVRTLATATEVEIAADEVRQRREEVAALRAEVGQLLAQAQQEENQVRAQIAAEQAERERQERERRERERQERERREREAREARDRAARQAASRSNPAPAPAPAAATPVVAAAAPASAPAAPSGGIGCPVGSPRSYSDTYGAPRSGGRAHKGTDIVAPRGTPIYAYESGTITRLTNSSLGGISLYLRGDSGTQYYYTHLQGYVGGLSSGQRVSAGEHIAFNGDTGNARGTPHLHFEVMPGGGGNVNPYPYVRRACG
jgi:peptidoglycan LD-endopeptidase LytH